MWGRSIDGGGIVSITIHRTEQTLAYIVRPMVSLTVGEGGGRTVGATIVVTVAAQAVIQDPA